jgi:hypothetical protein
MTKKTGLKVRPRGRDLDPKNDPNISRTSQIACWGYVRLIAVIAVIAVYAHNQSIISEITGFSIYFSFIQSLVPQLPLLPLIQLSGGTFIGVKNGR